MQVSDMLDSSQILSQVGQVNQPSGLQDMQRLADQVAAGKSEQVAQEFEAIFTSMLLKQMRESLTEGLFGSDQGDVYGGLFDMLMGQHLAKSAPLGVDRMVERYLQSVPVGE